MIGCVRGDSHPPTPLPLKQRRQQQNSWDVVHRCRGVRRDAVTTTDNAPRVMRGKRESCALNCHIELPHFCCSSSPPKSRSAGSCVVRGRQSHPLQSPPLQSLTVVNFWFPPPNSRHLPPPPALHTHTHTHTHLCVQPCKTP